MTDLPVTRLVVARHGNTFGPGDTVTRVGARTDLPLVASGLAQGAALGKALKQKNLVPAAVYTSALQRTIQTAREAQGAMGTAIKPQTIDLLSEIDYGPDENRPEDEVSARIGDAALEAWEQDAVVPRGWRADPAAITRGWLDFASKILQDHAGQVVLAVTSNGTARFAPHITGDFDGFRKTHKIKLATGAFGVFSHDGKSWRCEEWNTRPGK